MGALTTRDGEELYVGQPVKIHDPFGSGRRGTWADGEIVKIGRKYVHIKRTGASWDQGTPYHPEGQIVGGVVGGFKTLKGWELDQRRTAADELMRSQGVEISYRTPWTPQQRIALALAVVQIRRLPPSVTAAIVDGTDG